MRLLSRSLVDPQQPYNGEVCSPAQAGGQPVQKQSGEASQFVPVWTPAFAEEHEVPLPFYLLGLGFSKA